DLSIIGYTQSGRYIGMTLQEAAESVNQSIDEFAYNLVVEEEGVETLIMFWQIPEEKSERILNHTAVHPRMMIASDGVYEIPHPHPRGYGCFAQFGRKFVRERQLLSWEEAIWKMSGFPAERFGLKDRGQLKEGLAADIVVFDPETLADKSTWSDPLQPAVGVEHVLVNGQQVIADSAVTNQLPGRVLRRS
ncbi:MAG: amidohydrolase family protein, partial [Candidatus Poribacteria bacterium]|nr:amidohydrolase family protein [Candidatus Poribacteria bacterium]